MTHKMRDCFERPRAKGAKWTGKDIRPDEVIAEIELDWDGKRDRWNGYDASAHLQRIKGKCSNKLIIDWELVESERQKRKALELDNMPEKLAVKVARHEEAAGDSEESPSDEEKYAEQAGQAGQRFDAKTRMTVRNLRIREDTAKYLLNLDPNSAFYDPKTRSMRDNPNPNKPDVYCVLMCRLLIWETILLDSVATRQRLRRCSDTPGKTLESWCYKQIQL